MEIHRGAHNASKGIRVPTVELCGFGEPGRVSAPSFLGAMVESPGADAARLAKNRQWNYKEALHWLI